MAYSTLEDLNLSDERLVELTENASAIGVADNEVVLRTQNKANARVDAALFGYYPTPLPDPVPPIVVDVETAIWKYLLYCYREIMETPKSVIMDYEWAMEQLKLWSTGSPLNAPQINGGLGVTLV